MLEAFRLRGDLLQGVSLESGGILRVEKNYIDVALPKELPAESSDNRILKVCKGYQEVPDSQKPVILVTKSITLRLKAQMLGILAEDYTAEQVTDWASPYTCLLYTSSGRIPHALLRHKLQIRVPLDSFLKSLLALF